MLNASKCYESLEINEAPIVGLDSYVLRKTCGVGLWDGASENTRGRESVTMTARVELPGSTSNARLVVR